MFKLTKSVIDPNLVRGDIEGNLRMGSLISFEGIVRNFNEGKKVKAIDYEIYQEIAQKEGEKLLIESSKKFDLFQCICVHRYGYLKVGEIAVIIITTSMHRKESFKASEYIISELKKRLPIWKKEYN